MYITTTVYTIETLKNIDCLNQSLVLSPSISTPPHPSIRASDATSSAPSPLSPPDDAIACPSLLSPPDEIVSSAVEKNLEMAEVYRSHTHRENRRVSQVPYSLADRPPCAFHFHLSHDPVLHLFLRRSHCFRRLVAVVSAVFVDDT